MLRFLKKRSKKAGLPPGTLIHIGEKMVDKVRIQLITYDEREFQEKEVTTIKECFPFKETPTITWIDIDGLHQVELIEKLGTHLDLHPLLLEDILNTGQRPKIEDYGRYLFIVLKMLEYDETENEIKAEQVSLILGSHYMISFQESIGDVFNPVRKRIKVSKGQIRKRGPDYLTYTLIDAIVDAYFVILENVGDMIEDIETELVTNPTLETLQAIHQLKREMIMLRKSVWPLREVISNLERSESPLIQETTAIYLRDVYDHTIQVIDTIETFRDMLSGMLDMYLSSISNKMNEIMKVLTIIATIFIPLTFIAGIYGMNFRYMPELEWRWGYPIIWLAIVAIMISMVVFFRRKQWL